MDLRQMISTIQIYIHHKKGVEVDISPNIPRDYFMQAYSIAQEWCDNNLVK